MNDKFLFKLHSPESVADMVTKAEAMSQEDLAAELANLALIITTADLAGQQLMTMFEARHKLANAPVEKLVSC